MAARRQVSCQELPSDSAVLDQLHEAGEGENLQQRDEAAEELDQIRGEVRLDRRVPGKLQGVEGIALQRHGFDGLQPKEAHMDLRGSRAGGRGGDHRAKIRQPQGEGADLETGNLHEHFVEGGGKKLQ